MAKHLPATPSHIDRTRRQGHVGKSPLCTQLIMLITTCIVVFSLVRFFSPQIVERYVEQAFVEPIQALYIALLCIGGIVFLILVPSVCIGIFVEFAQIGFRVYVGSGFGQQGKLSPAVGLKKIASGVSSLWLQLLYLGGLVLVGMGSVKSVSILIANGNHSGVPIALFGEVKKVLCVIFLIALSDFAVRRWQHARTIMMDQADVKKEMKEAEGDPYIKAHRRALHQSLMLQSLETRIKRASCVVVERKKTQSSL